MTQKELNEALTLHKQWLESDGEEGKCANPKDADLHAADLHGANLKDADLHGAKLKDANLKDADLSGANLKDANLKDANLNGTNLDYSVWPLWCGSFDVKCDIRLASQLAYHFCRLECDDAEVKDAQNALLGLANKFHRVGECGVLKPKPTLES